MVVIQEGVESEHASRLSLQVLPVQLDSPQLANVCVFAEGKEDATAKGSVIC